MSLVLEPSQGLHNIAELHQALREVLMPGAEITIDASALEHCDLSLVQLLEAGRLEAARIGASFALASPVPACLLDTATLAGVAGAAPAPPFWTTGASA
jgi:hypothetical protein